MRAGKFIKKSFILVVIALFLLTSIVYGSESLTEELEKDYSELGITLYGKVVFKHFGENKIAILGAHASKLYVLEFPKTVAWNKEFKQATSDGALASGDINSDGKDELVVGGEKLWAFDENGNMLLEYDTPGSVFSLALGDLNGDGKADIIAGLSNAILAVDEDGNKIFETPVSGAVRDVEFLNGKVVAAVKDVVYVVDSDGNVLRSKILSDPIGDIALVDVDENGELDIVATCMDGYSYAFDIYGNDLWKEKKVYTYVEDNYKDKIKIIPADLNEDGKIDNIIIFTGFIHVLDLNGNKKWDYPISNDVALADMNQNGIPETIVAPTDTKIHIVRNGDQVGFYYLNDEKVAPYNKTGALYVAVIDLDKDGYLDDILGVNKYNVVFVLNHKQAKVAAKKIVVVANSIDYSLAKDFFEYLRNINIEVVHIFPEYFEEYKNEKRIVILGGHKAPEGTGDIIKKYSLLYPDEMKELEKKGSAMIFKRKDIFTEGQRIIIVAGSDRYGTQKAHREFRKEILDYLK